MRPPIKAPKANTAPKLRPLSNQRPKRGGRSKGRQPEYIVPPPRPPELHEDVLAGLKTLQERGECTRMAVEAAALRLGRSTSTVYEHLRSGPPRGRSGRRATFAFDADRAPEGLDCERALVIYYSCRASPSRTAKALEEELGLKVSPRQITYAAELDLPAIVPAAAMGGHQLKHRYVFRLRLIFQEKNSVWQMDAVKLKVELREGGEAVELWLLWIIDCCTRAVMGWVHCFGTPNKHDVAVCFKRAIAFADDQGPFGGIPDAVWLDRDSSFLANDIRDISVLVGFAFQPVKAHAGEAKGGIEQLNWRIHQDELDFFPFAVRGTRNRRQRLHGVEAARPHRLEVMIRVDEWIHRYNHERPHSALDGATPLQAWLDEPTKPRAATPQQLMFDLMRIETRIVRAEGVRVLGDDWAAPEIAEMIGEEVEVRYLDVADGERGPGTVEVYDGGQLLCVPTRQKDATLAEQRSWLGARGQQLRSITDLQRNASEAAAERFRRSRPKAVVDAAEAGLMDIERQDGHPRTATTHRPKRPQGPINPLLVGDDDDLQEDTQ